MKKNKHPLIALSILLFGLANHVNGQFFSIQAIGPVDVCYPNCVNLQVVNPQAGYQYNWFIGLSDCNFPVTSIPISSGNSYCAMATGQFYCTAIPPAGPTEISNPIDVRVLPGTLGSINMTAPYPSGPTNCVQSVNLCIPANFYMPFPGTNIKWYINNTLIPAAGGGSFNATTTGYYKYTITTCVVALSDSILVTIQPAALITPGGSTTFCQGDSVQLNANTGAGYAWQWKLNGNLINGATNSSFVASTSGSYTVTTTVNSCSKTSLPVVVTVNPFPSALISAGGPTTFCKGGQVTLMAPSGAGLTYKWKKSGVVINGATSQTYLAKTSGNYKAVVTSSGGCTSTTVNATTVTVNNLPVATVTPLGPTTFCAGGSVVLQANTGAGLSYKWKKNGNFINAATNPTYTATQAGNYKIQVSNTAGCTKLSAVTTITIPCREPYDELYPIHSDFMVFPNPTDGDFTIEISPSPGNNSQHASTDRFYTVTISDLTGRTVYFKEGLNEKLKIPGIGLDPGIFMISLRDENGVRMCKKLVKTNH